MDRSRGDTSVALPWKDIAVPGRLAYDHRPMPSYELGSAGDPLLGQQIEGYRVSRFIGHGAMGAVYEAAHESIGKRAAIKVLFSEFSEDEEAVQRFISEARAASKVQHGGSVQIFNHGTLADGTAYIVMEFLAGESLKERLSRLRLQGMRMPVAEVLRLATQITSALSAVHREGIVHRDLKPANLLLVPDADAPGEVRVKIVDFGIAKFDEGTTTDIGGTTIGRFLGTALYASPEQCQMAGAVSAKADIYALGVILYEALAGLPPFQGGKPGVIIGMHLLVKPRPLWDLAPDCPGDLCALVHDMLIKEPARRPDASQVMDRLARIRQGPGWLWRLRRSSLVSVGAGLVLLGMAGVGYQLIEGEPLRREQTPAGAQQEDIRAREDLAGSVDLGVVADLGTAVDLGQPREQEVKQRRRQVQRKVAPVSQKEAGKAREGDAPPQAPPAEAKPAEVKPAEVKPSPSVEPATKKPAKEKPDEDDGIFR